MTATLKQINVSYSRDEDRIAVKFLDSNSSKCAWLTYSVAVVFLPHLSKVLGVEHGIAESPDDTRPLSNPQQEIEKGHARLQFEKRLLRWRRSQRLISGDQHKDDKGEELLIKEGRLAENGQSFQLVLLAVNGRQATIVESKDRTCHAQQLGKYGWSNGLGDSKWVLTSQMRQLAK